MRRSEPPSRSLSLSGCVDTNNALSSSWASSSPSEDHPQAGVSSEVPNERAGGFVCAGAPHNFIHLLATAVIADASLKFSFLSTHLDDLALAHGRAAAVLGDGVLEDVVHGVAARIRPRGERGHVGVAVHAATVGRHIVQRVRALPALIVRAVTRERFPDPEAEASSRHRDEGGGRRGGGAGVWVVGEGDDENSRPGVCARE